MFLQFSIHYLNWRSNLNGVIIIGFRKIGGIKKEEEKKVKKKWHIVKQRAKLNSLFLISLIYEKRKK